MENKKARGGPFLYYFRCSREEAKKLDGAKPEFGGAVARR
jgi:hypothetical protein